MVLEKSEKDFGNILYMRLEGLALYGVCVFVFVVLIYNGPEQRGEVVELILIDLEM
jgi:hypothetical protein